MIRAASRHIAIWIDHHEAILLAFEGEPFDRPTLHRPGDGYSQHRVDAQQYPSMQQYYDAVLSHLQPQDEILILGPGRAKSQLRQRIEQHGNLKGKVEGLHQASKLAEVELVFPTGEVWRSDKAGATQVESPIPQPVPEFPEAGHIVMMPKPAWSGKPLPSGQTEKERFPVSSSHHMVDRFRAAIKGSKGRNGA